MVDLAKTIDYFPNSPFALEDFYRAVFSSTDLAVYVIHVDDGAFTFHDANELVARIADRPLAEIRGKTPQQCLPKDVAECLTANLERCVETNAGLSYLRTLDLPQGRTSFTTVLMPVPSSLPAPEFVVGFTRDVTHMTNFIESADHNAVLLRTLGIAFPSAIYLLDIQNRHLRFIGAEKDPDRRKWRKDAEAAGHQAVQFIHPEDQAKAEPHLAELADLRDGEVSEVSYRLLGSDGEYRRHLHRETVFSRDPTGAVQFVIGVSEDVSEQDRARDEVRDISARMVTLQIDERRRIAQELHDSTGQHLTAVGLALAHAKTIEARRAGENPDDATLTGVIEEARRSLSEAQREIRVLSYLLHPPQIRSEGLADALNTFAAGFGQRAGLKVEMEVSPDARLIDDDIALQVFRICQEALTNIYRHAHAKKAVVSLAVDDTSAILTVRDDGIGFDVSLADEMKSVGLPGMRERMDRLGGAVELSSRPGRTTLIARMPRNTAGTSA